MGIREVISAPSSRHVTWTLAERPEPVRFLVRDRDQKFTDRFHEVFRGDGIEIVRPPFRAPQANGVAERFVRTVRSECLDWMLILNQQHLERVLDVFVTITTSTGLIEHCLSHRRSPDAHRQPANFVFTVAIVSVVWFTSTSWRRDRVFAPYRCHGMQARRDGALTTATMQNAADDGPQ